MRQAQNGPKRRGTARLRGGKFNVRVYDFCSAQRARSGAMTGKQLGGNLFLSLPGRNLVPLGDRLLLFSS